MFVGVLEIIMADYNRMYFGCDNMGFVQGVIVITFII